jgi:hypothetical protein
LISCLFYFDGGDEEDDYDDELDKEEDDDGYDFFLLFSLDLSLPLLFFYILFTSSSIFTLF